jgi:hypothetical protein
MGTIVEVAAVFGLPLPPLAAVAMTAFDGAFDLGGGEPEAGPHPVGPDLGDRPLVALGGLPAALAQPAERWVRIVRAEGAVALP